MLLVNTAIVLVMVLAVLISLAIYLVLRNPGTFDNVQKMVQKQYPSLFHPKPSNHNGNG